MKALSTLAPALILGLSLTAVSDAVADDDDQDSWVPSPVVEGLYLYEGHIVITGQNLVNIEDDDDEETLSTVTLRGIPQETVYAVDDVVIAGQVVDVIIAQPTVDLFAKVNPVVVVANGSEDDDDENSGLATDVAFFYVACAGDDSCEVWSYVIDSEGEFEETTPYEAQWEIDLLRQYLREAAGVFLEDSA